MNIPFYDFLPREITSIIIFNVSLFDLCHFIINKTTKTLVNKNIYLRIRTIFMKMASNDEENYKKIMDFSKECVTSTLKKGVVYNIVDYGESFLQRTLRELLITDTTCISYIPGENFDSKLYSTKNQKGSNDYLFSLPMFRSDDYRFLDRKTLCKGVFLKSNILLYLDESFIIFGSDKPAVTNRAVKIIHVNSFALSEDDHHIRFFEKKIKKFIIESDI